MKTLDAFDFSASSETMSEALLPIPTTSTRLPRSGSGSSGSM
jgi:hypothetical protein